MTKVYACNHCVDPREHGVHAQHGLSFYNGMYTARRKGGFISPPSPRHDISVTAVMLRQLGKEPILVVQGHRDCAAVKVLFDSHGKDPATWNTTEREFQHTHGHALRLVKSIGATLSPEQQLSVLEKICVLQSINNFFAFDASSQPSSGNGLGGIYAYYSLTPVPFPQMKNPEDYSEALAIARNIDLQIFDPAHQTFALAPGPRNEGIRAGDMMREDVSASYADAFKIVGPLDLPFITGNEIRFTLAKEVPRATIPVPHARVRAVGDAAPR